MQIQSLTPVSPVLMIVTPATIQLNAPLVTMAMTTEYSTIKLQDVYRYQVTLITQQPSAYPVLVTA
jgi:hypothetical protein